MILHLEVSSRFYACYPHPNCGNWEETLFQDFDSFRFFSTKYLNSSANEIYVIFCGTQTMTNLQLEEL